MEACSRRLTSTARRKEDMITVLYSRCLCTQASNYTQRNSYECR